MGGIKQGNACPPVESSADGQAPDNIMSNILVLNPGSSSLKFRFYESKGGELTLLDKGVSERIGEAGKTPITAMQEILAQVLKSGTISSVGYRVVHGGARFTEPTTIDSVVLEGIRELGVFAPLHNPPAADVIEACRKELPEAAHVAVFDTAFHRTLPPEAYTYALPYALTEGNPPLRRYGFHGIAYQSVCRQLQAAIPGNIAKQRFITCHLGSGASVCAIRGGASIDTSMGLTPLEGLVMGTRSGDMDPSLSLTLLKQGRAIDDVENLLNHESGLKGISGISGDLRDLEKAAQEDGGTAKRAELAMDIFAYRVARYIGAYAVVLGGVDAIALSGGIGEHSAPMRQRIVSRLSFLGVILDTERNSQTDIATATIITTEESRIPLYVCPVDEEGEIARTIQTISVQ
jgi:acetate kinase